MDALRTVLWELRSFFQSVDVDRAKVDYMA